MRNIVWLRGPRSPHQQLSHLAGERGGSRDVCGIANLALAPAGVPRMQRSANGTDTDVLTGNRDALLIRGPNGNARSGSRICDATLRAAPRPGHELLPIKIAAGVSRRRP